MKKFILMFLLLPALAFAATVGIFDQDVFLRDGVAYDKAGKKYTGVAVTPNHDTIGMEVTYKDGVLEGTGKFFVEGKLKEEYMFKDGLMNGPAKFYDENGKVTEDAFFVDGIKKK